MDAFILGFDDVCVSSGGGMTCYWAGFESPSKTETKDSKHFRAGWDYASRFEKKGVATLLQDSTHRITAIAAYHGNPDFIAGAVSKIRNEALIFDGISMEREDLPIVVYRYKAPVSNTFFLISCFALPGGLAEYYDLMSRRSDLVCGKNALIKSVQQALVTEGLVDKTTSFRFYDSYYPHVKLAAELPSTSAYYVEPYQSNFKCKRFRELQTDSLHSHSLSTDDKKPIESAEPEAYERGDAAKPRSLSPSTFDAAMALLNAKAKAHTNARVKQRLNALITLISNEYNLKKDDKSCVADLEDIVNRTLVLMAEKPSDDSFVRYCRRATEWSNRYKSSSAKFIAKAMLAVAVAIIIGAAVVVPMFSAMVVAVVAAIGASSSLVTSGFFGLSDTPIARKMRSFEKAREEECRTIVRAQ